MTYDVFTSNLSKLKAYKKQMKGLEDDLNEIFYEMTGVKGVGFDSIPTSFNPHLAELKRLDLIDEYEDRLREYNFMGIAIEIVETMLKEMPEDLQRMLKDKFVKGMTYEKLGMKYGYSHSGIQYKLKTETEKYL